MKFPNCRQVRLDRAMRNMRNGRNGTVHTKARHWKFRIIFCSALSMGKKGVKRCN